MDHDQSDESGRALATRPNGRFTSPLVINKPSQRRDLFARGGADENVPLADAEPGASPKRSNSSKSTDAKVPSAPPSVTKIPRPVPQHPATNHRRPFSLSDALKVAENEEETELQASPSPAPRSWRIRRENSESKSHRSTKSVSARSEWAPKNMHRLGRDDPYSSGTKLEAIYHQDEIARNDLDQKPRRNGREPSTSYEAGTPTSPGGNIFAQSKLGPNIAEAGKEFAQKANSNGSGRASTSPMVRGWGSQLNRRVSARNTEKDAPATVRMQSDRDTLIPSVENDDPTEADARSVPAEARSPEKSFAWQVDTDFTAGDLQVSTSPPVRIRRSNTKIDEIKALEAEVNKQIPGSPRHESLKARPKNSRIDEIRSLEAAAALKFPEDPETLELKETVSESIGQGPEASRKNRQLSPSASKRDESRIREIDDLSKRALATARIDEIRDRNSLESLSSALETSRNPGQEILPGSRSASHSTEAQTARDAIKSSQDRSPSQADSRYLLQRLARAASTSPIATELRGENKDDDRPGRGRDETSKPKRAEAAKGDLRPTVGFAGLRRDPSAESHRSSRSNLAHSDSDPTDRIEGEMKLFAPREDYSEKGSLRAPSPEPNDEDRKGEIADETPRPTKPDPLSQPTPRIVGAYVETPATIKIEQVSGFTVPEVIEPEGQDQTQQDSKQNALGTTNRNELGAPASLKVPGPSLSREITSNGRPKLSNVRHGIAGNPSAVPSRRRSRSLPKRMGQSLTNSVNPPTVRDDLLAIQRHNQIEDSTLDDFEDLLESQEDLTIDWLGHPHTATTKVGSGARDSYLRELEVIDRMNKSLRTGLLGIRTAKQGIERLEDKVSNADIKSHHQPSNQGLVEPGVCASCQSRRPNAAVAYLHLPVPRLWHRDSSFRFTWFGTVVLLLSFWYLTESIMCSFYCKPDYCFPNEPCRWSHDDPVWGYSIPVKLDQWIVGGHGRQFANQIVHDISDLVADVWDSTTGTALGRVGTDEDNRIRRQQRRRRLLKRGLIRPAVERPEEKVKYEAWRAGRLAWETADAAREMGYDLEDDSMSADERIR